MQQYAGFTPQQQLGFGQTQQYAQSGQPYFQQAGNYFNQSASPISGQQIGNYLNPYAGYVLGNLAETQGQQMQDLTGRLTQQAGGVGASRIGVGQAELARQQNLATGQTLSGIYGQALSAAQQDAMRQQAAGYGMGNLGATAQGAALQGAQANFGMGTAQQNLAQQQLNAQYANTLQRLAYPYQNTQYLAGITGGLAGALGGTTSGYAFGQPPTPSPWSQLAGLGTAGAGIAGAMGAFGNQGLANSALSGEAPTNAQISNASDAQAAQYESMFGASGGRVQNYDDGGKVVQVRRPANENALWNGIRVVPLGADPVIEALKAYQPPQEKGPAPGPRYPDDYADGGGVESPDWMHSDPYIPNMPVQSQAHHPQLNFSSPQKSTDNIGSDIAGIAKGVAAIAPLFASQGGAVENPFEAYYAGGHYQEGGDVPADFASRYGDWLSTRGAGDYSDYIINKPATERPPLPRPRPATAPQLEGAPIPSGYGSPSDPVRMYNQRPIVNADDTSAEAGPRRVPVRGGTTDVPPPAPAAEPEFRPNIPNMSATRQALSGPVPYADINPNTDVGRGFAKSPWLALIAAGAGMMGPSPYAGVNIGAGLTQGVKTLEEQRKELQSEEAVNQRARQLALEAQKHIDEYTKITPEAQERINIAKQAQEQANLQLLYEDPVYGTRLFKNKNTGELEKYGPSGKMPVGPMDMAKGAQTPIKAQGVDTPEVAPPANTSIAPPGGTVAAVDPEVMIARPQRVQADFNPEIVQSIGGKGQVKQEQSIAQKERADWNKTAVATDRVMMRASEMKNDLDTIMAFVNSKPDGALQRALQLAIKPGPGAEAGVSWGNFLQKFGSNALPAEVQAAAIRWSKNATLAGFNGIVGEGLSAREAMPIIKASMGAVANINLPEASNRALIASAYELAQRTKDKATFLADFMRQHGGMATGWQDAFEQKYPMGGYIARAVISALPPQERAKLSADTQLLRQTRDVYMAAEKAGNHQAATQARTMYERARGAFNQRYGGTADYFAFGRMM